MKLNCPECATPIPAENINIQKMAAVCPNCGAVFQFEPPQAKAKRRKVHQPQELELHDTDARLSMAFRTNWRLSQDASFISTLSMSASSTFVTLLTAGSLSSEILSGDPFIWVVPAILALITLGLYYLTALNVYNKTHIEMDDQNITVSRKPLSAFWEQASRVSLAGITSIRYEETPVSKKEGYDLPRFNVWAETADGNRRMIVKDVVEDYAVFIAQRLNERLLMEADADIDVSRLAEDDRVSEIEDEDLLTDISQTTNGRYRG